MSRFEIGIFGWGLLPLLLARHLLAVEPQARLLLLSGDRTIGGESMEPVRLSALGDQARELVTPYSVLEWPGYYIAQDGSIERHDEPVWLLDPVQAWLDLEGHADRCVMQANSRPPEPDTDHYMLGSETATIARLIDLAPLTSLRCESEILGMEAVRQLGLPILADFDTAAPGWEANQLLPLGDERVLVRKLPHRTGLVAANSTFESLLNALIAP